MSLPANSLMHVTAQNTDATAFQHTGTFYILSLSMKMDVSTHFEQNSEPMSTVSPRIQGTHFLLLQMTEEVKEHLVGESEIPSCFLVPTMHTRTLLYPSCTWTMLGTVFTDHCSAMDKSCIVS